MTQWSASDHDQRSVSDDEFPIGHVPGVIRHSDRGGEYSSYQLERELRQHGALATI